MTIRALLLSTLFGAGVHQALAADLPLLEVTAPQLPVYSTPSASGPPAGQVRRGKRFRVSGREQNGFVPLKTKSGRALWITSDPSLVRMVHNASDDLEEVPTAMTTEEGSEPQRRWLIDLGASSGAVGEISYSEVNLGVSYFFYDWLAWRNAFFYRFVSKFDDVYGVDSSLRGIWRTRLGAASGVTLFGGPGARFQNEGPTTPFIEGGIVARLFGFSLGFGVKSLYPTWVDSRAQKDDLQYFIILGGSASL